MGFHIEVKSSAASHTLETVNSTMSNASMYSWVEQFAQDALKADFNLIVSIILRTIVVTLMVLFVCI